MNTDYRTEESFQKVKWFIDKYQDPKEYAKLEKLYKYQDDIHFGTICKATGVGKSADIYSSVIKHIKDFKAGKLGTKKLIINLSSPRLLLSQQTTKRLVLVLQELGLINSTDTCLVVNSSDDMNKWDNLFENTDFDVKNRDQICGLSYTIYIITSCYKSEAKLYKYLKKEFKSAYKVSYFDEAQKIDLAKNDSLNMSDDYVDIKKHLNLYTECYAYSATPEAHLTDTLLAAENARRKDLGIAEFKGPYASYVSPQKAIKTGKILPPRLYVIETEADTAAAKAEICVRALCQAKAENATINHKVLCTFSSTKELMEVRAILSARPENFKIFSTCSKEGMIADDKVMDDATIEDFIKSVEDWNSDCFVFHIRQLTEGIDINGLTDTIIFSFSDNNNYASLIQNVGRTLRFMNAKERTLVEDKQVIDYSSLSKKCGRVFFIANSQERINEIKDFFFSCYGINYFGFTKSLEEVVKFDSFVINDWYEVEDSVDTPTVSLSGTITCLPYTLKDYCEQLTKLASISVGPAQAQRFKTELLEKINEACALKGISTSAHGTNTFFTDIDSSVSKSVKRYIHKQYPALNKYLK